MNKYNVNVLAAAKEEYTKQLVNILYPHMYVGIKSIYDAGHNYCKSANDKNILNMSFVMKKKIGSAVIRNRIKRKLKSAVLKSLKEEQSVDLKYTYVIFGRNNVYKDKFQLIFSEVNDAFKKIKLMAN